MCNYYYIIISDLQKQEYQMAQTNVLTEIRTVNFGSREDGLLVRKRHDGSSDSISSLDLAGDNTKVST